MIATLVRKGTKYDCNLNSESDHIWLESLLIRTKYDCNVENCPRVTLLWFLNESRENKFSIIAIIFGPFSKRLQSYMVRFELVITNIFGPFCGQGCNHIWSKSYFWFQIIYGPLYKNYCNNKWGQSYGQESWFLTFDFIVTIKANNFTISFPWDFAIYDRTITWPSLSVLWFLKLLKVTLVLIMYDFEASIVLFYRDGLGSPPL